jgi:hypothetical protein
VNFPVGTQQHFHTDSVHFSSIPERFMCGVWIALEDVDEDAGPLLYFPGSHEWPIYTNEHIGLNCADSSSLPTQAAYEPMWAALARESGIAEKKFRAKKGQALIWLSNFLHGGSRQTDKTKTRWSQVTHYFFEDCAYYTPMHSDPFYGSIAFRRMADVRTGAVVENRYLGAEIPKRFRKYVEPPKKPATPPDLREPAQAAAAYGQRLPRRRGWRERIASLLS